MFAVFKNALNCYVFVLFFSSHLRVSRSRNIVSHCSEELDDVISKTVMADVVLMGSVSKIFSSSQIEFCAEFGKVEFLKGNLENEPLVVCRSNLKCDETLLEELEKYIIFINSTESSDKEIEVEFYHMASSPLPYSSKTIDNILGFLDDPSIGQSPKIEVPEKTSINESFGDRTNLACTFTGFPIPIVHWKRNGVTLQPSEDIKITTNKSQSILDISELHVDHTGTYECFAQNVFGSDRFEITVNGYKMHAHSCSDNSFCYNRGNCYFSDGKKLCECKSGFGGLRCQWAEGESREATSELGEARKSIQTLLLMITIAIVITGVVILVYASIRSFYVGANYKKIRPNSSSQLLQPEEPKDVEVKSTETNGVKTVVPVEVPRVHSSRPVSPRQRLNGTSTFFEDAVWNSRKCTQHVHVDVEDGQSLRPHPRPDYANTCKTSSSSTYDEDEIVPIKVSII